MTTEPSGFRRFEFPREIERGIADAGFINPRPIQRDTIPAALEGQDILGLAQTGTGKTAAFALPLLDFLVDDECENPRALVVAPTRELATQIDAEIRLLARHTQVKTAVLYGGVPIQKQINALKRRVDILVACPGRLLDLHQRKAVNFRDIECLVLDEADHMFDMGFLPDLRRIIAALPADRQNLLFSATMPKEIRALADKVLHRPHVVELADSAPAETIDHALCPVDPARKRELLEHLLRDDACSSAIVFTRTKHRARQLARQLGKEGHNAVALQGNMSQSQRDRAMKGFRAGQFEILVATDIAARGIDVSDVSHVINFDVPNTPEAYTHRIGRTGRKEKEGTAITFVTNEDRDWIRATERMIGAAIPLRPVAGFGGQLLSSRDTRPSTPRPPRGQSKGGGGRPRWQGGRRKRNTA